MNGKGFTLVELLLSIVVLALIMIIAVPSINGISNNIRERQRNNNIEKIKIAASKYAFDTGKTLIFVDELVTEGYIESDDEEGNVIDPLNNIRMNCYVVEMEKVSDYYKAKFIDGKNYDIDGVCDLNKLQEISSKINVEIINNGVSVSDTSKWLTGKVSLRAYSDTVDIDCAVNKCEWFSSSGANLVGKDQIDIENVSGILSTNYTFQVTVYEDESAEVKRYKTSVDLKIDNESPIIYENEIQTTNKFIYTSTKKVTIIASDGNGSGIAGYYLAVNNGQTCKSVGLTYQSSNVFEINSNGNYIICVKDNAGNVRSYTGLNISYIE